jgi:hypothetical protein
MRIVATATLLATLLVPGLALATPDAGAEREIRQLIDSVSVSGCTFLRNGEAHDPAAAAEHLAMKYGKARRYLDSTEEFIDKVATRSFLTGSEYRVSCNGRETATGAWLGQQLKTLRAEKPASRPPQAQASR